MRTDQVDSADRPLAQQDVQKRRRFTDPHYRLLDGSRRMRAIRTVIENIADTDATVLIRGESGVGKDIVARAIHAASSHGRGPFIKVNCAAIPPELLESELFGHEVSALILGYNGPIEEGVKVLAPARQFGKPVADLVGPVPYRARQCMLDEDNAVHGLHRYWRSAFTEQISDGLIDVLVEGAASFSSPSAH